MSSRHLLICFHPIGHAKQPFGFMFLVFAGGKCQFATTLIPKCARYSLPTRTVRGRKEQMKTKRTVTRILSEGQEPSEGQSSGTKKNPALINAGSKKIPGFKKPVDLCELSISKCCISFDKSSARNRPAVKASLLSFSLRIRNPNLLPMALLRFVCYDIAAPGNKRRIMV